MSYILDALKKAERERGIAQVPTLATVHEAAAESPRKRLWIVTALFLVVAAIIVWSGISFLKSTGSESPATSSSDAGQLSKSVPSAPSLQAVVPSEIVDAPKPPAVAEPAPAQAANNPRASQASTSENRSGAAIEIPRRQETAAPSKKIPIQPAPELSSTNAAKTEQPPQPEIPQISFRESAAKMNMTILMYAEAKSDRMVFINDRKYVEGDYVDGKFLLESITPEGAVLSYQGERLTIHPRAK